MARPQATVQDCVTTLDYGSAVGACLRVALTHERKPSVRVTPHQLLYQAFAPILNFQLGLFARLRDMSPYIKYVRAAYHYAEEASFHMRLAELAALPTLVFRLLSQPRWRSFFALAVFVYALHWFSHPIYVIP